MLLTPLDMIYAHNIVKTSKQIIYDVHISAPYFRPVMSTNLNKLSQRLDVFQLKGGGTSDHSKQKLRRVKLK
jgi:hypothetical protein